MIPNLKMIDELRRVDVRTVDKETLADMSGVALDPSLPKVERMTRFLEQVKNPYCFRLGDMVIKLEFADNAPPLQDVMTSFLFRQKSGL